MFVAFWSTVKVRLPGVEVVAVPLDEPSTSQFAPVTISAFQLTVAAGSPKFSTSTVCVLEYPPPCRAWKRLPVTLTPMMGPLSATNSVTTTSMSPPADVNRMTSR